MHLKTTITIRVTAPSIQAAAEYDTALKSLQERITDVLPMGVALTSFSAVTGQGRASRTNTATV